MRHRLQLRHRPAGGRGVRLLGGYELCDATAAAALLGADVLETEAALAQLVDLGLAEWGDGDTYRLPGLMRLFAAGHDSAARRRVPVTRW